MSSLGPRASIVQFFGSFALGILIGGIIAYIGNTELVNFIRPLAILFFAAIAVLVALFLYLDSWRRRALNSTLANLRAFLTDHRDDLIKAYQLMQANRMTDSLSVLPRPRREHFDALSRIIQVYAGMTTASSLINVSIAAAAALLAAAMVSEQNKLIKNQNRLIQLQHRLERNRARASAIEYVDNRYYLFKEHEANYPTSTERSTLHYADLTRKKQDALRRYWSLVYAQWLTLGGGLEDANDDAAPLPSYTVWLEYLTPIVRSTGRKRAAAETLCVLIRDERWPGERADFVHSVLPVLHPEALTTFLPCCHEARGRPDAAIQTCGKMVAPGASAEAPEPDDEDRTPGDDTGAASPETP